MASPSQDTQSSNQPLDGHWLCNSGSYLNYINYLCKHQPSLRHQDPSNWFAPVSGREARVAFLELESNGRTEPKILKAEELTQHLPDPHASGQREPKRRIFIMEGLRQDFIKAFGESFGIEPSFFAMQERKGATFNYNENVDNPALPSLLQPENSFCISYYELWAYTGDERFQNLADRTQGEEIAVWCKQTGRPITWYGWRYKHAELLLVVPRKCSVWVRKRSPSDWDTVVLCDPPPNEIYQEWPPLSGTLQEKCLGRKHIKPFDGGYNDFIQQPDGYFEFVKGKEKSTPGPPRNSMLDDICHYYKHHSDLLKGFDDPTIFVKKITAAHYIQLTGFVTYQLESIRSADWSGRDDRAGSVRRQSREDQNVQREDSPEAQWRQSREDQNVQREESLEAHWLQFRCSQYVYDVEVTLLGLGIPWGDPSATTCGDWRTSEKDFQYISRRLVALREDYDRLTTAMVGLGGMTRNRQAVNEAAQSLREAKTVKTLTFIALFFIPMEWMATLFSMSEPFLPGGRHFWVYFVLSVPTVLFAFVITSLIQLGYNEKGIWSSQAFLASMKDMLASIGTAIKLKWVFARPKKPREMSICP